MAKLLPTSLELIPQSATYSVDMWKKESAALEKLCKEQKVIKFHVADGYAYYLVVKEKPLILQHVGFGDNYQAHPALIRGLTLADVNDQLDREERLNKLFARRA